MFDFESIRLRLITNLRKRSGWKKLLPNSVNMRLIEAFAEEEEEMSRYSEYLLRESKWDLARNRTSLFYQAALLGYIPHRNISARGTVEVSTEKEAFSQEWLSYAEYSIGDKVRFEGKIFESVIEPNLDNEPTLIDDTIWKRIRTNYVRNIGIPKFTEFSGTNGLTYTSTEAVTLGAYQDYAKVPIIQGKRRTNTFIADGDNFEEVFIESERIENSFIEVSIEGFRWRNIENLRFAENQDTVYQVIPEPNFRGIYIRFGDDVNGKKLSNGDSIVVNWIESGGTSGNINSIGGITTVSSSIVDVQNNTVTLSCYNYDSIVGGRGIESTESIRRNGILSFQAGDRLVSANDYRFFIESTYDFIGKAVVWGAYEQNIDQGNNPWDWIPTDENFIFIAAITPGENPLDITKNSDGTENNDYKLQLIEDIQKLKSPTDIIAFKEVELINMVIDSSVFVGNENYLLPEIVEQVEETFMENYGIERIDFFDKIYESNYKSLIDNLDGVRYNNTEFSFYKQVKFASGYSVTTNLPLYEIKEGTVKVVVETLDGSSVFEIAADDEDGNLIENSGYDVSGVNAINYSLGSIDFSVNGGLSDPEEEYNVKIHYDTVVLDVIPKKRNQILYLKREDINISAEYFTD